MLMTASLRVKNGIYQIIFSYYDENGKRKQRSESTGLKERGNKRKAEAMMKARLEELEAQSSAQIEAEDVLFLDAMEEWLTVVMPTQVRQNTLDEYKRAFNYHLKPYERFQRLPIQKLSPQILQSFYNGKVRDGLSPNTIHKLHANISKFLKYALRLDMIEKNPAERVTLPKKVQSRKAKFLSPKQLQSLLRLFWGDPIEPVVYLAVHLGVRRSEACGLQWESVDFERRRIMIRHTAVVVCGKVIFSENTKSESSRRVLAMSGAVAAYLEHLKQEQQRNREKFGNTYYESNFVCTNADGTPINPDFVSHHFPRVLKTSELPPIRFHDLRHSCASLLHASGYDLKDIQTWLGHSDIQTTGNIYTHLDTRRMDNMAQAMGDALAPKLRVVS